MGQTGMGRRAPVSIIKSCVIECVPFQPLLTTTRQRPNGGVGQNAVLFGTKTNLSIIKKDLVVEYY